MSGRGRAVFAAGALLLLRAAASAAEGAPPASPPASPPAAAPAEPTAKDRYPTSQVPLKTLPKTSAQPVPFNAGPARPSPLTPPAPPEAPPAAAEPQARETAPAAAPAAAAPTVLGYPQNPAAVPAPPLGSELRGKLKEDERHFLEKGAEATRAFERSQAEERAEFAATLASKGFWERRRLLREFKAAQAERRKKFNDEQKAKRRTYEWRYP